MNEFYETVASFLEELRCDSKERKYAVKIDDLEEANQILKEKHDKVILFLDSLQEEDKNILEEYLTAADIDHFKEEQRAYYQGIMDGIQILGGLGLIKKSENMEMLLKSFGTTG